MQNEATHTEARRKEMVTCQDFLKELNDFLDETTDPALRAELEKHITECPNCWVICDTTRKTISVYKGMEPQAIPPSIHEKLMSLIQKRCGCGSKDHAKEESKVDGQAPPK
ncbi:anti-sigma factor [uncultured Paludibaculum sp.]|uniref:anti-sigma factor family protein n=1 Tax=uncultured Paludibaculum sp. TaxID=1765020 RepID=UPI002AAC4D65|nr:anti-sigma factor [uncultured Paludibaculum sp.]